MLPFKTFKKQALVVMTCFILHNFIKRHRMTPDDELFDRTNSDSEQEDDDLDGQPRGDIAMELEEEDNLAEEPQVQHRDVIALNMWHRYMSAG